MPSSGADTNLLSFNLVFMNTLIGFLFGLGLLLQSRRSECLYTS